MLGLVEPVAPGVVYTHAPARRAVDMPPPPPSFAARKRQADARLRRAVRAAWADPALARGDCTKVAPKFAELRDVQGMANTLIAHAEGETARL